MIAIGLIRIIAASVMGLDDHVWTTFWVQVEASVSVIAICPTAFRSLFLIKNSPKHSPNYEDPNQIHASAWRRLWGRKKPTLTSIKVGATLTGMRTMIREYGQTQLETQDGNSDGDRNGGVLSSTEMQDTPSIQSSGSTKRSMEVIHEAAGAMA